MTLDEAFQAAVQLLEQRGQLLNGHLFRLVDGDKDLFRDVRERLIAEGLAEDCSGAGLALAAQSKMAIAASHGARGGSVSFGVASSDHLADFIKSNYASPDWWLMTGGTTRGPFNLATLCEMRSRGEFKPADVVRCGTQGLWLQPGEIKELAHATPPAIEQPQSFWFRERLVAQSRSLLEARRTNVSSQDSNAPVVSHTGPSPQDSIASSAVVNEGVSATAPPYDSVTVESGTSTLQDRQFIPPDKLWSLGHQPQPGRLTRAWNLIADLVGGSRRLMAILLFISAIGGFSYWWGQPPPARTIFDEFKTCRAAILRLQDRRAKRSEWAPTVERYRPRVQSIVDRLKSRASDRYPLQQSLYLCATMGLLPLLENPMDPTKAERAYEQYIGTARELLDGKNLQPSQSANSK